MPRICEIYATHKDEPQHIAATVTLTDDGQLRFSGSGAMIDSVRNTPVPLSNGKITASSDPRRWFEALPFTFNGFSVRAQIVGDTEEDTARMVASLKKELAPND